MARTTPGISLLMVTPRPAATLPTDSRTDSQAPASARAVPTASGGGPAAWAALPNRINDEICANFVPASTPITSSKRPAAMTKRMTFEMRRCAAWSRKSLVSVLSASSVTSGFLSPIALSRPRRSCPENVFIELLLPARRIAAVGVSSPADMNDPVPLLIVTGFLGAGKTTVLNRVLGAQHARRLAVVVNELGRIDIDTKLIKSRAGDVMELVGGCVCHEV